jgi:site-specific DNA recombinase
MRSTRRPRGDPKVAVGFCRVSTDRSRQELGAESQRACIEDYAARHGIRVVAVYVEEISGGAPLERRKVLMEALAAVAAHGAGALIVKSLDRFSREPLTAALAEAELLRHGANLIVADGLGNGSDPTSELVRNILFSVAKFEKCMIRLRIKAALQVKKSRGELTGVAPYGFRRSADGKTLEANPDEVATMVRLRELRSAGLTLRALREEGARQGLVNRRGNPFTLAVLHHLIKDCTTNADA